MRQVMGSDMLIDDYDMVDEEKQDVAIITPTDSPDEPEADSTLPDPEPTADDCERHVGNPTSSLIAFR